MIVAVVVGREECRAQARRCGCSRRSSRTAARAGEVDAGATGAAAGSTRAPQLLALGLVGELEAQVQRQPALERRIDVRLVVRGQEADAGEGLEPLEQVVGLEVRVAIVARLHVGALAEQRVRLVEQQDRVAGLGRVEQRAELLLGLADPLRDELAEVDLIELEAELASRSAPRPSSCRCPAGPRTARTPSPLPTFAAKPHCS